MSEETFTDFIVGALENEDVVAQAVLVVRRKDDTIGYRTFNQQFSDTLGMLRVASLSIENDLTSQWREES